MEITFELGYALDTFYFLICGALVMWMAAGFTMLEAGLVRAKNTTEILTKNVSLYAISCIMYMICGYSIMYGGDDFSFFLKDITGDGVTGAEEPAGYAPSADFFFQVVFVATAMSIVSGAVAERMKLWAFLAFAVVLTAVIYPMSGSWTWGGADVFGMFNLGAPVPEDAAADWMPAFRFSDFAGSGIVHMAGAAAALAGVLVLGARKGKYGKDGKANAIPGANLPLATLGTFILWMGWFGFNGGSVLATASVDSANSVAVVFMNTNMAAAGGLVAALLLARILFGKADLTMALNGALAGLVAITAEPSTPTALQATLFGALGGALVVGSILALDKLKIDDPVGAISVHGTVGLLGLLLVPITNPLTVDVVAGETGGATFVGQLVGALTIFVWVFVTSLVVWLALKAIMGIRVSEEEEYDGVDISECGLEAYPDFTSGRS
ncbi:ammonium transporter [Brumicola blandensis]|jgi:Amt family ammonium transporter|uniref:Ammonium transporter n=1 Tax=Brumicola blandensis TaxID=3075611 RepID=A0AAW8R2G4_9ALTE|nr:ammonium transporter [Alteromonas sp. W409]MDT0582293.1 ammonium transporter [Alteromonas sp. W409]